MKSGKHTLELFRSLTKCRAVWHGDIISRNWGEVLYVGKEEDWPSIREVLSRYTSGDDYSIRDNEIWI
jgi:hypothetical protein